MSKYVELQPKHELLQIFSSTILIRRAAIQKNVNCRTPISGSFCILNFFCELETPNLAVFLNIFIYTHSAITNVAIHLRRPMRFIMLQWIGIGTPPSCDYAVSNFLCYLYPIYQYSQPAFFRKSVSPSWVGEYEDDLGH